MPAWLAYPVCRRHGPKQPGSKPAVGWSGHEDCMSELSFPSGEAVRKSQHQQQSCLLPSALDAWVYMCVHVHACAVFKSTEQRQRQPTWSNFLPLPHRAAPTIPVSYKSWPWMAFQNIEVVCNCKERE